MAFNVTSTINTALLSSLTKADRVALRQQEQPTSSLHTAYGSRHTCFTVAQHATHDCKASWTLLNSYRLAPLSIAEEEWVIV
jgi:hypothetical protein